MHEATCNRCGSSVVFSAKFCRQCGNRLDDSELTTRTLAEPQAEAQPFDHPTRLANAGITAPTYAPPAMMEQPPLPPVIGSAPPTSNKSVLLVILGIVMAMLIGLGVLAFLVLNRQPAMPIPPPPPTDQTQTSPPPPLHPGIPPPSRPSQPTPPVKSTLDPSLIYPGATVGMDIGSKDASVTQLQTSDDMDKVVSWYVERIKPTTETAIPGGKILEAEGLTVLINQTDKGTSILVTREPKARR